MSMIYYEYGDIIMLSKLLIDLGIELFAYIPRETCKPANMRLYSSLPESCNVIFMLFPYATEGTIKTGEISAYGAVPDYHAFAKETFTALEKYIENKYPGRYARGFSDHSPFLECEGAALAGLGIIGDHSLLISKKYSSFVFIGELVTTLSDSDLAAEGIPKSTLTAPMRCEGCGECKRACPTGCAGTKERTTCISSVTQKKGEVSPEDTAIIRQGGSIWGCDICQLTCPHTKKAVKAGTVYTHIPYFRDRPLGASPSEEIENMSHDTFALYPFAWRKRETVIRNINIIKGKEKND